MHGRRPRIGPVGGEHLSAAWLWGPLDLREVLELLDRSKGHRGGAKVRAALDAYRRSTTRVTETRLDREPGAVVDSLRQHLARRAASRR
jgi:hypothetical protein